jgi:hypothetical protein
MEIVAAAERARAVYSPIDYHSHRSELSHLLVNHIDRVARVSSMGLGPGRVGGALTPDQHWTPAVLEEKCWKVEHLAANVSLRGPGTK